MVVFLTKKLLDEKNLLSKIWLAAHWDKKLSKYQIYSINIENTVKQIMSEEIIVDLRISGHLLVGIVRIFSRKTMYLLHECSSIFSRVRIYQTGLINLPDNKRPLSSITLPDGFENFDDFKSARMEDLLSSNQSRLEDITLKETYHNIRLIDDEFDEKFFNEMNQGAFDDFEEDASLLSLLRNDKAHEKDDKDGNVNTNDAGSDGETHGGEHGAEPCPEDNHIAEDHGRGATHVSESDHLILIHEVTQHMRKTERLHLDPLPVSFKSAGRLMRRKRKLIIDEVKMLDEVKIQNQFRDIQDVTIPLDLAPPSKRLMTLKEIGSTNSLFHLPGLKLNSHKLLTVYQRNLKVNKNQENEYESSGEESAYGSCEKQMPNSDDLFPEELMEIERGHKDSVNLDFSMNAAEVNLNSDSSHDDGVVCDFQEPMSQPTNFSDGIQLEASLAHSKESGTYNFQNKIVNFLKYIERMLKKAESIKFSLLVQNEKKNKVARKFLFLLMLKKFEIVELDQEKSFDDIIISRGFNFVPAFTELCLQQL